MGAVLCRAIIVLITYMHTPLRDAVGNALHLLPGRLVSTSCSYGKVFPKEDWLLFFLKQRGIRVWCVSVQLYKETSHYEALNFLRIQHENTYTP